ncbi:hypothetical protein CI610_01991 [invertebrate metagenome]|uniref:Uncharacterized protein n=1 Tax=invertebrate metagenome TaxID=1711999 RepID=A0A2H9T752_9ZZZZ
MSNGLVNINIDFGSIDYILRNAHEVFRLQNAYRINVAVCMQM